MSGYVDAIEVSANRLTLCQAETLLLIAHGRRRFSRRAAKSVERLVDRDLVTAKFDISERDPLRGRVHEIWHDCLITPKGLAICKALKERFLPLMSAEG